jgi:uncharacterized protein YeaO (DUF488 family)
MFMLLRFHPIGTRRRIKAARVYDDPAARYAAELETEEGAAALAELRDALKADPVTLVTATRDLDGSHVAVLVRLLS